MNEHIIETDYRLTTLDNPYDPFEDFTSWFMYDVEKGYSTCGYLERVSNVTEDMSQKEASKEIERAIDEIIELNPLNIYKKVRRQVEVAV